MPIRSLPLPRVMLLLTVVVLFAACRKDPEVPKIIGPVMKLTVRPMWNNVPFDKTAVYVNPSDQRLVVTLLKFYLSDLTLVNGNRTARVFDADLFDVTNGPLTRIIAAPAGDYTGLHCGLGLPPELNHGEISHIPVDDPLGNNSGMYWTWATMYKFVLFEGRYDTDATATGLLPYGFSLHTGRDTLYRTMDLPMQLHVDVEDTARLTLVVDLARFFNDGQQLLDLTQGSLFHGEADLMPLGIKIADMESAAFRVKEDQ